jgi:LytR cell envelope-related transcriptional attenuator
MQTTERPPSGPARGSSPMRGVVLVAVAAVLGFFVLRAIDDTGGGPSIADLEAASDTTGAPDTAGSTDTTAAPQARPPGEVVVLVANASGIQGAAGAQSEAISAGGYQVLEPTNSPTEVEATQVLATAGFEADAAALAAAIGAPETAVAAMPEPPPFDLTGANVVVMLGPDLAGGG